MKKLLLILLLSPIIGFGQNSFYLGGGMISSFANSTNNRTNKDSKSSNLLDFGLYYGNNLKINNYLETVIEVFYLNNRVVLTQNGNKRFELHQNIGFGLKPGFYYKKHSIHLSTGIIAVYLFDKDEVFGNQIDYFDESFFYGIDYNYDFTKSVSCNLGVIFSKFEKISQWTDHALKDFSVVQLTLHYNLN